MPLESPVPVTPFREVLIGDDGADGGRAAIALARALAPDAQLVLARAYPYDETPGRAAMAAYGRALAEETALELARTRDHAGLDRARIKPVPDSSPARALHRLAEAEDADLIAVGSSHRGPLGRLLLGDVGRNLLHGAPCPVAVVPLGTQEPQLQSIGVAYDGSPEAEEALVLAAGLARARSAELHVVYVVESDILPTVPGIAFNLDDLYNELREDAQVKVDAAVRDLGVQVHGGAVVGTAAGELGALAERVDLLVCGSRGWGAIRRVILGSTSDRLIHHAPCPVLVVPRPDEPPAGAPAADALPPR